MVLLPYAERFRKTGSDRVVGGVAVLGEGTGGCTGVRGLFSEGIRCGKYIVLGLPSLDSSSSFGYWRLIIG